MISKVLTLLLNVLMERAMSSGDKSDRGFLANFNLATLRRVLLLVTGILASLIFFLAGLMTVLMDLVLTSRDLHGIFLSQTSWVGLGLVAFSVLSILWLSSRKMWMLPVETPRQQSQPASVAAPILDAVTTLVATFLEEKRLEREMKTQAYADHMAAQAFAQQAAQQAAAQQAAAAQAQADAVAQALAQASAQHSAQSTTSTTSGTTGPAVSQNDPTTIKSKSSFN